MRIFAAPKLEPDRVIVMVDGDLKYDFYLWDLMEMDQPQGEVVDIYMHPDAAADFQRWQREELEKMRRLN
jgi:hypothetical protein